MQAQSLEQGFESMATLLFLFIQQTREVLCFYTLSVALVLEVFFPLLKKKVFAKAINQLATR